MSSGDDGDELPDDIVFPPDLLPGLDYILEAFWDLSTDRQIGMSIGPLPWSSIQRWLTTQTALSDYEKDDVRLCFREMDTAYIMFKSGKAADPTGKPGEPAARMPDANKRKLSIKLFDALWGD